jgi:hypothetical protein
MSFKQFFTALFSFFIATSLSFAKNLNLYDLPKDGSKVVGTIDSATGIIPIFSPKDVNWVKVADPKNGNVGWIKSTDLNSANGSNFSFKVITTGSGPNSYQVVQFGSPQPFTSEQAKTIMKNMEVRQQQLQKDIQKMMQNMLNITGSTIPMLAPMIIVPDKQPIKNPVAASAQPKQ